MSDKVVGQPVSRIDGRDKVTGRATYAAEFAMFVKVARGEAASPCTAHDGVEALRIAEAATTSLHEHRPVRLEEIPG